MSNPPIHNIPASERRAIKSLQQDQSITIVPADKGKCLIVMNKEDYRKKVDEHLNNKNVYVEAQNDPTNSIRNKVNKHIKDLKERNIISAN